MHSSADLHSQQLMIARMLQQQQQESASVDFTPQLTAVPMMAPSAPAVGLDTTFGGGFGVNSADTVRALAETIGSMLSGMHTITNTAGGGGVATALPPTISYIASPPPLTSSSLSMPTPMAPINTPAAGSSSLPTRLTFQPPTPETVAGAVADAVSSASLFTTSGAPNPLFMLAMLQQQNEDDGMMGGLKGDAQKEEEEDSGTSWEPKDRSDLEKGFTKEKVYNAFIPTYVPPEIFVMDRGLFLEAFLARCAVQDCSRLVANEEEDTYYANAKLEVKFDHKGHRINTAAEMLAKRNQENLNFLKKLIARFKNETTRDGEVSFKYKFKPHEIPLIGSLFGARGETQKWLVRESGVLRIEFAGRGLTKRQKKYNAMRGTEKNDLLENEDPHAFIVGYDKAAVGEAARLIEWLLSDAPDAVQKRDENHRRLKEKDGTYDPTTYKTLSSRIAEKAAAAAAIAAGGEEEGGDNNTNSGAAEGGAAVVGSKRPRADDDDGGAKARADEDSDDAKDDLDFLDELL